MNVNIPLEYLKDQFQHTFCSSHRTSPKILKLTKINVKKYWVKSLSTGLQSYGVFISYFLCVDL